MATGNVKVGTPTSFITSERVEFDTQTRTGVFYNANGMAALGERVDKSFFGTQEADALFRGREIHKLGPKKYKVVDGAFSTCVQPTPRWEVVSGSATINLDDYALLKNSVFRVKGVPLMYLPIFYYPIQEDDRATGSCCRPMAVRPFAVNPSVTRSSGRSRAIRMRPSSTTGIRRRARRSALSTATS